MSIHRFGEKADKKVADLIENKSGKHSDGGGLYLQVASAGQASWVWRHKERWKSIGPASVYKIEEAREIARGLRKAAHEGRPLTASGSGGTMNARSARYRSSRRCPCRPSIRRPKTTPSISSGSRHAGRPQAGLKPSSRLLRRASSGSAARATM